MTFYFLANAKIPGTDAKQNVIDSDPFDPYGPYVFQVIRSLYLMALISCFISSMGNRPQGSKWMYIACMVLFAGIMGIMLFYCGWNVFKTVPKTAAEWSNLGTIITERPALRDIVISLASTYGLYIVSSLLFLEPWHMITCFVQYLFLMPSFMNILMIYACKWLMAVSRRYLVSQSNWLSFLVSNLHDVSWGTKGDNSAATDLGSVSSTKTKDGQQVVQVEIPTERTDINASYDKFLASLRQPRPNEKQKRDAKTKQEDHFKQYRTNVVLSWMFSNALIVIVLTSDALASVLFTKLGVDGNGGQFNPFLKVCE